MMVSQDSILDAVIDALPEGADIPEGLDVDSIRNLLPPTALVVVYLDVPSELAEEKAEAISSAFSDAFGIGLRRMIALSPPLPESDGAERAPLVSIVVYEAPDELADLSEAFIDLLPADRGGLVELMEEAHERGRLTPGVASGSPDCAAMFTGFVNLATLGEYLPLEELDRLNVSRLILPSIDAPLGLTGAVSYWKRGIQSPPGAHTFDMLRLLGVESPVSFSSDADMSNVFMIATNLTLGAGMDKGDYAVTLTTTTPLTEAVQGVAQWMTVTELPPGALVDPSHFRIDLSGVMPLNVAVSKQASPMEASRNGEVQVTVTVRNDDDHQMMEVALDDGDALLGYPTSTSVASGSTGAAWAVIHPGESKSLTYTVKLGSSGVYTLRPAAVRYVHGGKAFSQDSNPAEVRVSRPSALPFVAEAVASTWSSTSRALDGFTGGNGSSILMASTAAWAAALAFMEYRGFRKWLSGG
ncbi:hypothetical protein AC482_04245 [miscellaneous Crenarchaeota group-15 archaeon DG-45]|uniref:DUF11 domain-containing protein n=1 Tax=miscellaneous Crenarchaeota group-15 archaeon DG-45 TaxID=1685127 RepID=A0A0M0BNZ9_9ARCH|nr:MAG: hypothetical protein AC482_04245 [miscellaneous Crenarchaeota group-15 archaeon DG-45]